MPTLPSTRQIFIRSMPSIFDTKTSTWPNPERSVGTAYLSRGGLRFWLPIGPALAAFEVLSRDLKDLLDKHKDAMKQGEQKPCAISFQMWMIGAEPESSNPTIVFSSKSVRQRMFAKALLKNSKLLDQYPGVRIKTLDRMPAIYRAGSQDPDTIETTNDIIDNVHNNDCDEEAVYMVDDSRGSCGALIAFERLRLATMGGALLINGSYYGISAQHGRYKFLEELEDVANEDDSLCFDDDSDTEDSDLANLVEVTSRESISSFSDDDSSTVTSTSTSSTQGRSPEYPTAFPTTTESTLDNNPEVSSPSQPTYSSNPKISNLLPFERNDLDYEVFEIGNSPYRNLNKIDLPGSGYPSRRIIPNKVARTVVECPVWAVTGTTGCVQGTMMRQPHYIKMEGSETFQEMWVVKLERNTKPGDSGAWVVDDAGQLFGHIVAGDPMLGLAFVIPAYKIFDDIKSRFGEEPLLCPSTSVIQRYSAPNHDKLAEQLLLDLMKGNDTGTMILHPGLPRVDNTITDEAIVSHARGARYSMECGHLEWSIADIKGIVEMTHHILEAVQMSMKRSVEHLLYSSPLASETRSLRCPAKISQIAVQEVPDGRMAFSQGDPSGILLIIVDALDELMPATFSDTAFSAKPPSFASIVPSIGAYNYIDSNHETDGYARADELGSLILRRLDEKLKDDNRIMAVLQECCTVNQIGQSLLVLPLHLVGRPKEFELMQETQWVAQRTSHWSNRRWARLQLMRCSAADDPSWSDMPASVSYPGSGIVPIREARMQMQDPHPLDQYGNHRIPPWSTYGFYNGIMNRSALMRAGCLSVTLSRSYFAVDDSTPSTDTSKSLYHKGVTYNSHQPFAYEALSYSWRPCPPTDLSKSNNGASRTALQLALKAAMEEALSASFPTTVSFAKFAHQSRSSAVGVKRDESFLECPFRIVGCSHKHGLLHNAQWLVHQISHYDTNRSSLLDTQRICPREQALWIDDTCVHDDNQYHTDSRVSYLVRLLYKLAILQRDEQSGPEEIEWLHGYYAVGVCLQSLSCDAVPTYGARPSGRHRLNAPQLREYNSQCSDPSEEET